MFIDDCRVAIDIPAHDSNAAGAPIEPPPMWIDAEAEPRIEVPLAKLAWARSGDKGNLSNIGLIARRPQWLPLIWNRVTPEVVQRYFAHLVKGRIERYHLPGIAGMNLVLHGRW